jgi:hypothetical protein
MSGWQTLNTIALIGLFAPCVMVAAPSSANQDHLISFNFESELGDRSVLLDKLVLTNQDYGRFLILPSDPSEGEIAVAVHTGVGRDLENTFVTYTKADRNLWFSKEYPKSGDKKIEVARIDAPIAKTTAKAVAEAWRRMLYRTQPRGFTGIYVPDPTVFEVSLVGSEGEAMYGRMPLDRGKHTEALYQLAMKLIDYCKTDPSKRPAKAKEIEEGANSLVSDLAKTPFCRP